MPRGKHKLQKSMRKFDDIKANVVNEFPGELGLNIGGSQLVEIPTRPGFVYVRLRSNLNEVIQAYNDKVSNVYGLKVKVARDKVDKSRWYVVGKDTGVYQDWGSSAYLPDHHQKHEFNPAGPGNDIVWVYSQQFMPFLIYPSGSSALYYAHPYYDGSDWNYSGLQLVPDLSGYKPTGSNARVVLVYIDSNDTPTLLAGDYIAANETGTANVVAALPALPTSTTRPLAAIRLLSGTTSLAWNDIYDLRQFIGGFGGSGSSGGSGTDEKAKVSSNDTTAGYLNGKLVAGAGIVFTENNDGGNETLTIASTGSSDGIGGAYISTSGASSPPTEAQLITAFGTPDDFASNRKIGVLNPYSSGTNTYAVFSDGGHYWIVPLAKATEADVQVSVASTGTITTASGDWCGRAAMEVLPSGNVVMVYAGGTSHSIIDGVIHIRFSSDYGATWSDEDKTLLGAAITGFPAYPTGAAPGDDLSPVEPWLMQAPNGDLLMQCWKADIENFSSYQDGSWQSRSSDGGETWDTPTQISFADIINDDMVMMTDDHFILDDVIYAGFREYQTTGTSASPVRNGLVKSDDNGATWTLISYITEFTDDTIEVGFEYIGNNRIVCVLRGRDAETTYRGVSNDLGMTWTLAEIQSETGIIGRPRIFTRAHVKGLDTWWNDSVLILIGFESLTPGSYLDRKNAVWISQDRGMTWEGAYYLDALTDDAGYGDLIYDPNNKQWVFVSYQGSTSAADIVQYNLEITGI